MHTDKNSKIFCICWILKRPEGPHINKMLISLIYLLINVKNKIAGFYANLGFWGSIQTLQCAEISHKLFKIGHFIAQMGQSVFLDRHNCSS